MYMSVERVERRRRPLSRHLRCVRPRERAPARHRVHRHRPARAPAPRTSAAARRATALPRQGRRSAAGRGRGLRREAQRGPDRCAACHLSRGPAAALTRRPGPVPDTGRVLAWGQSTHGQLGTGNTAANDTPRPLTFVDKAGARTWRRARTRALERRLHGGEKKSAWARLWGALDASSPEHEGERSNPSPTRGGRGRWAWDPLQAALPTASEDRRCVAISCGGAHTVCVMGAWAPRELCRGRSDHPRCRAADGSVWSWGLGRSGRLGHGTLDSHLAPKLVTDLAGAALPPSLALLATGTRRDQSAAAQPSTWSGWRAGGTSPWCGPPRGRCTPSARAGAGSAGSWSRRIAALPPASTPGGAQGWGSPPARTDPPPPPGGATPAAHRRCAGVDGRTVTSAGAALQPRPHPRALRPAQARTCAC